MKRINKRGCRVCRSKFEPVFDTSTVKQLVCSCKCAVKYYLTLVRLGRKGKKVARETAAMVGRRSMAEVRFDAAYLECKPIDAVYEMNTFEYDIMETCKYTPDWTVCNKSGAVFYIEYKGVLDRVTRKKMKLVKKQRPELDIRFVFEKASNKIMKGSKTTYGMWADQYGFPWADNVLPKEWLK